MNKVLKALKKRYGDGYVVLSEVNNGVGGMGGARYADYIVLSMWPSRGLDIIGFERKSSRSDWLSEYRNPRKAELFFGRCNRWYLVTDTKDVARKEEIPKNWGWVYVQKSGNLRTVKEAPRKDVEMSKPLMFSMIRRAYGVGMKEGEDKGRRDSRAESAELARRAELDYARAREKLRVADNKLRDVQSMERELTGNYYGKIEDIAPLIRSLNGAVGNGLVGRIRGNVRALKKYSDTLDEQLTDFIDKVESLKKQEE